MSITINDHINLEKENELKKAKSLTNRGQALLGDIMNILQNINTGSQIKLYILLCGVIIVFVLIIVMIK